MDSRVTLTVYDRATRTPLWSASEERDFARRKKNREKNIVTAVNGMVSDLRSRMEQEPLKP
jgi:hypothetical protein